MNQDGRNDAAEVVRRAQDGASADRLRAFEELVRRFQRLVYAQAYVTLGDFHLAEDATQEGLLLAWEQLGQLREPAAVAGWLRRLTLTACNRMTRRKQLPLEPLAAAGASPSPDPDPAAIAEARDLWMQALKTLGKMPAELREAVTLFYISGHSQQELAAFLEIPVSTVKNRLHQARKQLRETMETMAEQEFKRRAPGEPFTQRVVTLAQILSSETGKEYVFQFANGVTITTRIEQIVRDERRVHLLICGRTKLHCHTNLPYPRTLDSFVLVPSTLISVRESTSEAGTAADDTVAYEISGMKAPSYDRLSAAEDPAQYTPLPVVSGPFDLAPDGLFGFVRVGAERAPYPYCDAQRVEHTWDAASEDVFVSLNLIRRHALKGGEVLECACRPKIGNERFRSAVGVLKLNGAAAETNKTE